MTEQSKGTRPSQVTMAGWVAIIGSALLVLTLFDSVSRLRTVEFRDTIDEFLSTPPGSGLGLEIPQVVEIMRVLMLFSGAAAAAATVLAIYVLQRHNAARVGFTIAAVAIMLTAPVTGGFLPVMIAFAAIMLWTRPARDWFAGRPVTQPEPGSRLFGPPRRSDDSRSTESGGSRESRRSFAAQHPSHRVEGNTVSSENNPPQEQPDGQGSGSSETPSWPRMPEDGSGRPVPPPTQGFGSPQNQQNQQGQQGQQGGADQEGQGQPGRPQPYPGQGGYPGGQGQGGYPGGQGQGGYAGPQGGPSYPQGGYPPPYGQQPPYGQSYGGQPAPYGQQSYGQQSYGQGQQYGYPQQQGQQPYYGGQGPADPDARPTTVTIAAWITWALATLSVLFFVLVGFVMVVAEDEFIRQLEQDPTYQQFDVPTDQVIGVLWVMGAIALFWGIAAMVLAWFAYRRANWARIALVVSAAFTVLFSLLTFPVGLLHTLGAGAVIVLLFIGGAQQWYSRRDGGHGGPGAFQPYGQPGQQYGDRGSRQPYGGSPQQEGGRSHPQGDDSGRRDDRKDEPPSNVW